MKGSGLFQWNAGGWFGGQLGATLWLILLGAFYARVSLGAGCFVVACGLVANGIGGWLWWRRDRVAPYAAIQILCATAGLAAAAGLMAVDLFGDVAALDSRYERLPLWIYILLLMYPAIMGQFWLVERGVKNQRGGPGGKPPC